MKILFFLSLMLMCITIHAQSVWQRTHSDGNGTGMSLSPVSANNAWLGSGLLYEFGESELEDQMLVSGRVLLELAQIGQVHLPIMSNVELTWDQPISEFNIGLYPWQSLSDHFVAHAGIQFDTDGQLQQKQFRLFAGGEFSLTNDNGLPMTFSVTPVFVFGDDETDNQVGIDGVIVVPLANGLGLLAQVEGRFKDVPTRFALGVVTNKIL